MANQKTHPSEMDTGNALKQHDNLHKQITAFEKLLQHAMNKFSREKLYGMLKILTKDFSREYTPGEHVYSMAHLKRIVSDMETTPDSQKSLTKETEKHVIKYFKLFFEDVEYLKELKKYFDEKIYICLYEYFYDPLDDVQENELDALLDRYSGADVNPDQTEEGEKNESRKVGFEEDITEVYTGDRKEEEITFDFLSAKGKLSHAVRQMFKVNEKWDGILNESDPHMECYDPDSKHELLVFADYVKYEAVLRLVPDVFVKAYKSVELSKLWWTQANKMYANSPRKRKTVKDLKKQEVELSNHILRVTEDIHRIEVTVLSQQEELSHLIEREARFHQLNQQSEKLEDRKDQVNQNYHKILEEMTSMEQELKLLEKGTKRYTELEARLREKDKTLMLTQDELKILAYHFRIVQEDFSLELELHPHLIRFRADFETKITSLKEEMVSKTNEKRKTEKILVLLKTNCERMKQIMQKVVAEDDEEEVVDDAADVDGENSGDPEEKQIVKGQASSKGKTQGVGETSKTKNGKLKPERSEKTEVASQNSERPRNNIKGVNVRSNPNKEKVAKDSVRDPTGSKKPKFPPIETAQRARSRKQTNK